MAHAARATSEDPAPDAVVWADATGRPVRLIWAGRRWRVTDRPTVITAPSAWWWRCDPLGRALYAAPRECVGWRFQATAEGGESRVFDLCEVHGAEGAPAWRVVKTYC